MAKNKQPIDPFGNIDIDNIEISNEVKLHVDNSIVESLIETPQQEVYIKPGFIQLQHIEKGGVIIVPEHHYGRVYPQTEWEILTDSKKK